MNQLPVVGEAVNHVQLVVEDPDVLLLVVGADLDLVRPAAARQLREQLVEMRPLLDEIALAVDDEDRVFEAALPAALGFWLARRGQPSELPVEFPRVGVSAAYGVHGLASFGSGSSPRIAIQMRSGLSA